MFPALARCASPFHRVARFVIVTAALIVFSNANAATRTVTTLADSGAGSLRDTLDLAESGDTVIFAPGLQGTIALNSTLLINRSLTLDGDRRIVIDGGENVGAIYIPANLGVRLRGLTIQRGLSDYGGGVFNLGALIVENCRLLDNHANSGGAITHGGTTLTLIDVDLADNGAASAGGAIFDIGTGETTITRARITGNRAEFPGGGGLYRTSAGDLTIEHSTISGNALGSSRNGQGGGVHLANGVSRIRFSTISANHATYGGGIYLAGATTRLQLDNSLVAHNHAKTVGGGVLRFGAGLIVTNSTLSGNRSDHDGGGLYTQATIVANPMQLRHVTLADNAAAVTGGGILAQGDDLTIANSLIARNTAPDGPGIAGALTSQGYNLVDARGTSTGYIATDLPPESPLGLENLGFNRGPTETHALQVTSAAINAVPPAACVAAGGTIDQRDFARPEGTSCDIGAFDSEGVRPTDAIFADAFE